MYYLMQNRNNKYGIDQQETVQNEGDPRWIGRDIDDLQNN